MRKPYRIIKRKFAMPYCVVCMWNCNLEAHEIDFRVGMVNSVCGARKKYGKGDNRWLSQHQISAAHLTVKTVEPINQKKIFTNSNNLDEVIVVIDKAIAIMERRLCWKATRSQEDNHISYLLKLQKDGKL